MEALKAEIERKRKAKETQFGGRKFARLADLQAHPDGDADARPAGEEATLAHASDDNQARRLCVGLSCAGSLTHLATATPQAAAASAPQASGQEAPSSAIVAAAAELVQTALPKEVEGMSEGEAVRRLRLLGHPAKLFGEGHTDRLLRLHVIQQNISLQAQVDVGQGQQANEWQRQMRDLAAGKAAAKQQEKSRSAAAAVVVGTEAEGDPTAVAFAAAAAALAAQRAEAALEPPDRVVAHFKRLMEEWEAEVQGRAEAQPAWAASLEGRNAVSVMRLSKEHIRPLFRQLKRRECPADIERALWCIVKAMRVRNYKEAGDLYVRLAIGNAPWPIGVTMVGIHERSAREKISATSTAHIMHDEQSRKYLQAVKRLITYAQRAHPSTPSLSLEFDASANWGRQPMMLTAGGGGAAGGAGGSAPILMLEGALPSGYVNAADGTRQDGWRANDADIRTWKSIMRAAYRDEPEKPAAV